MMSHIQVEVVHADVGSLQVKTAIDFVKDARFGGMDIFVGYVREQNLGKRVSGISYDLFEPLALRIFEQIGDSVRRDIDTPFKLYIGHAKGRLAVGDVAVIVAVGTPHRDAAFRGCRLAIEAVKHEAPIWKQEHYLDGDSAWSEGCSLCEKAHEYEREATDTLVASHGH